MSTSKIAFDVLTVVERGRNKTYFRKIGVAFNAKDGEGYNISLDALPIGSTILLRPSKADDQETGQDNGGAQ